MTFTSQLIVERSSKGSRASVKEQGKRTCCLVSVCWPGRPSSGSSELHQQERLPRDGEGCQDPAPLLAALFPPPRFPVTQDSVPTVGVEVAWLKSPPNAWARLRLGSASRSSKQPSCCFLFPLGSCRHLGKGFPPSPVKVILYSVLLRFLPRNLETHYFFLLTLVFSSS